MTDTLIFSCWFKPKDSAGWRLLEHEAHLQVGLRDKPKYFPRSLWRYFLQLFIQARFKVELDTLGGFIDDSTITVRKK